ncbi:hypothetical protein MPTK2_1g01060 [Marchantia polymorpha subsp. ruderalis]
MFRERLQRKHHSLGFLSSSSRCADEQRMVTEAPDIFLRWKGRYASAVAQIREKEKEILAQCQNLCIRVQLFEQWREMVAQEESVMRQSVENQRRQDTKSGTIDGLVAELNDLKVKLDKTESLLDSTQRQVEALHDKHACQICMAKQRDCLVMPCMHFSSTSFLPHFSSTFLILRCSESQT